MVPALHLFQIFPKFNKKDSASFHRPPKTSSIYYLSWGKKDISVYTPSASHKSFNLVEKSGNLLQQTLKKMKVPVEGWKAVLFHTTLQVDVCMIQYLGCSPVRVITAIRSITSLTYKSQLDSLSTKVRADEQMFPLVWDNIPQTAAIREELRGTSMKKKENLEHFRPVSGSNSYIHSSHVFLILNSRLLHTVPPPPFYSSSSHGRAALPALFQSASCYQILHVFIVLIRLRWGQRTCQRGSCGGLRITTHQLIRLPYFLAASSVRACTYTSSFEFRSSSQVHPSVQFIGSSVSYQSIIKFFSSYIIQSIAPPITRPS